VIILSGLFVNNADKRKKNSPNAALDYIKHANLKRIFGTFVGEICFYKGEIMKKKAKWFLIFACVAMIGFILVKGKRYA